MSIQHNISVDSKASKIIKSFILQKIPTKYSNLSSKEVISREMLSFFVYTDMIRLALLRLSNPDFENIYLNKLQKLLSLLIKLRSEESIKEISIQINEISKEVESFILLDTKCIELVLSDSLCLSILYSAITNLIYIPTFFSFFFVSILKDSGVWPDLDSTIEKIRMPEIIDVNNNTYRIYSVLNFIKEFSSYTSNKNKFDQISYRKLCSNFSSSYLNAIDKIRSNKYWLKAIEKKKNSLSNNAQKGENKLEDKMIKEKKLIRSEEIEKCFNLFFMNCEAFIFNSINVSDIDKLCNISKQKVAGVIFSKIKEFIFSLFQERERGINTLITSDILLQELNNQKFNFTDLNNIQQTCIEITKKYNLKSFSYSELVNLNRDSSSLTNFVNSLNHIHSKRDFKSPKDIGSSFSSSLYDYICKFIKE